LTKLLELQRLDDQLVDSQTEHNGIPARRDRITQELSAAEERLSAAKQSLEDAQLAIRRAEGDLQDRVTLLQKLEGQQFQVKSNDAYTALLREMEHAREAISEHETKILENMESIEQAAGALEEAEQAARSVRSRHAEEEQLIKLRQEELASEIGRFKQLRSEAGKGVERELLSHYERVAAGRRPAVVAIAEERCSGCLVQIPPQAFIEIKRGAKVITCGNCSRILLHAERAEIEVAV
jgi:predicted  nucleic acid-binding Zn-ribbon protein